MVTSYIKMYKENNKSGGSGNDPIESGDMGGGNIKYLGLVK